MSKKSGKKNLQLQIETNEEEIVMEPKKVISLNEVIEDQIENSEEEIVMENLNNEEVVEVVKGEVVEENVNEEVIQEEIIDVIEDVAEEDISDEELKQLEDEISSKIQDENKELCGYEDDNEGGIIKKFINGLVKLVKTLFSAIIYVIKLPFKLIGGLFKRFKKEEQSSKHNE